MKIMQAIVFPGPFCGYKSWVLKKSRIRKSIQAFEFRYSRRFGRIEWIFKKTNGSLFVVVVVFEAEQRLAKNVCQPVCATMSI